MTADLRWLPAVAEDDLWEGDLLDVELDDDQPLFTLTSFPKERQLPFSAFFVPLVAFSSVTMVSVMAQVRSLRRASLEATIVGEQILFATSLVSSSRRSSLFFFFPRSSLNLSLPLSLSSISLLNHRPRAPR